MSQGQLFLLFCKQKFYLRKKKVKYEEENKYTPKPKNKIRGKRNNQE